MPWNHPCHLRALAPLQVPQGYTDPHGVPWGKPLFP